MGTPLMWSGLGTVVPLWLSTALSGLLALGCICLLGPPDRSDEHRHPVLPAKKRRSGRHAGPGRSG